MDHRLEVPLPDAPAAILDVGPAGGESAVALARAGYDVFAVNPAPSALWIGQSSAPSDRVRRIHDELPGLERTVRHGLAFDAILARDALMQVGPRDRPRAFGSLIRLLRPGGALSIEVSAGPGAGPSGRRAVTECEIESLARDHEATVEAGAGTSGHIAFPWRNLTVRLPEHDSGTLHLLKQVIFEDQKSSTYKLALLRSLCRIADGAAGLVRHAAAGSVEVPLGLVALTWIRLYRPLLNAGCPQSPANRGHERLSFAKEPFRHLAATPHLDLRVGVSHRSGRARALHSAMGTVAATIARMPARYITYGDGSPILPVERLSGGRSNRDRLAMDRRYLRGFGSLHVPWRVWQALQCHSAWIEPAIVGEWIRLMERYAARQGRGLEQRLVRAVMTWSEPVANARVARDRAEQLLRQGRLVCVWSGRELSARNLDLDHCFPATLSPCEDLWNLVPADREVSLWAKRMLPPSDSLLLAARGRIMSWWDAAYREPSSQDGSRLFREARGRLPGVIGDGEDLDALFECVRSQGARLRRNRFGGEWTGGRHL